MMEAGMLVDMADEYGETALISAARKNRTDIVLYLSEKEANVDKQDGYGWTALYWASYYNNTVVIRMLKHGARKDIKSNAGNTPIDLALRENYKEAVDLLEQ